MKKVKTIHIIMFSAIILFALTGESLLNWSFDNAPAIPFAILGATILSGIIIGWYKNKFD